MAKLPSMDEILKEINRLDNEKVDGFTTRDLIDHTGMGNKWCVSKIRDLIRKGILAYAGKVNVMSIDNRICKSPVYKMIKK